MMYLGQDAIGLNTMHCRTASGEFEHTGNDIIITHNLGSKKILAIFQRVNSDHSNINESTRYRSVLNFAITKEALNYDLQQTYSYNNGEPASIDNNGTDNTYPSGGYCYFPAETGGIIGVGGFSTPSRGIIALNNNEIELKTQYILATGHWVWRAYALD